MRTRIVVLPIHPITLSKRAEARVGVVFELIECIYGGQRWESGAILCINGPFGRVDGRNGRNRPVHRSWNRSMRINGEDNHNEGKRHTCWRAQC